MKTIKVLSFICLLGLNLVLLSTSASAVENPGGGLIKGIKGSINGVDTCHCPDDKANCYCSVN